MIGWMVKVHNLTYVVLGGMIAIADLCYRHELLQTNPTSTSIAPGRTTLTIQILEVLIVSTIFNALLILNQGLMNPFDGTLPDADFPMTRINASCKENLAEYPLLAKRLPAWMRASGLV